MGQTSGKTIANFEKDAEIPGTTQATFNCKL